MRKPGFIIDEILMCLGSLMVAFTAFLVLGFAVSTKPNPNDVAGLSFTAVVMVGGIVMFAVGVRFRRLERQLRALLQALRSTDQSTVATLSSATGIPADAVRRGIPYLIGHGFVAMRYDPARDTVYSPAARAVAEAWVTLPGTCPNCHAPTPTVLRAADRPLCEYCHASLPVQPMHPERPGEMAAVAARGETQLRGAVFSGSWVVLVVLFVVFWPAAVIYLVKGLNKHGAGAVYRG